MNARRREWVILLAGGEGSRLLGQTVCGTRLDRPKQFCRIGDDQTLLRLALERAARLAEPECIVPVVCALHRLWWGPELMDLPFDNVLVQPENRGNAIAILHALIHILQRDPDPLVVVMPSDHAVEDEAVLAVALRSAVRHASERGGRVVLLGITPDAADAEYGWLVPGREAGSLKSVRAFIEKPSRPTAAALMRHGALWNSFIFASTGAGLLELYRRIQPELLEDYLENLLDRGWGEGALSRLYEDMEPLDFSCDLLEHAPEQLDVLRVDACGWTDLGTPRRVAEWLEHRSLGVARHVRQELVLTNAR